MKRREFGSLVITAVAGLLVSGAALASGKKTKVSKMTGAGVVPAFNPNSFYITVTTFFPYVMSHSKYKSLVKDCRNVEGSDKLMAEMEAEGKLLSIQSKLETDKVTSCFEFCDEKAFREYEVRFAAIPGNFPEQKKKLGFKSKIEYSRTVLS